MTNLDWKILKAKKNLRRRKENYWLGRAKKAVLCVGLIGATLLLTGAYSGSQKLVETTYTVQKGDTLWNISETYLKKNTGGNRYILEFMEGIKEINPELVESKGRIYPGQVLRINYWEKGD